MKKSVFILAILVVLLAVSCNDAATQGRTTLCLTLEDETSRTIMPAASLMNVQKYKVSGSGPGGSAFGPIVSTDKRLVISDIATGTWQVTATALNAENNELATGTSTVDVKKGSNDFTIVLDTVPGYGSMQLDIEWSKDISRDANITINTRFETSKGVVVEKTKTARTADGRVSILYNMEAGSYIMNITVADSLGDIGIGATEAIRIVDNTRTTGKVTLQSPEPGEEETGGGSISLTIENKVSYPMGFYVDYFPKSPVKGQVVTLKSCVSYIPTSIDQSTLTYQWYKDGVPQLNATGVNYVITAETGIHRYDVVVRSATEGSMCSASVVLNIPIR